jgi:hypothetical protein
VVATKLIAAALIGFTFTASALADSPTVRITSADQAKAVALLLRRADFGAGWQGGKVATTPLSSPDCPGFDPKESDLTVTGHADAIYKFQPLGVEVDQDVQVLSSAGSVETDFRRSISPALGQCLAYQLEHLTSVKVTSATVERVHFPPIGSASAVYRAYITVRHNGQLATVLSDYVFLGEGRVEYEFTVSAPVSSRDQLQRFEFQLAEILIHRAKAGAA